MQLPNQLAGKGSVWVPRRRESGKIARGRCDNNATKICLSDYEVRGAAHEGIGGATTKAAIQDENPMGRLGIGQNLLDYPDGKSADFDLRMRRVSFCQG